MEEKIAQEANEVPEDDPFLPAWFTTRMMTDCWSFGLLLSTGQILGIETITDIRQAADGGIWLDVNLLESSFQCQNPQLQVITAPTSRVGASINASHVVAAFELADT